LWLRGERTGRFALPQFFGPRGVAIARGDVAAWAHRHELAGHRGPASSRTVGARRLGQAGQDVYGSRQRPAWPLLPPHWLSPYRLVLVIHRPALVTSMFWALAVAML
jgi:hypothetical protein